MGTTTDDVRAALKALVLSLPNPVIAPEDCDRIRMTPGPKFGETPADEIARQLYDSLVAVANGEGEVIDIGGES